MGWLNAFLDKPAGIRKLCKHWFSLGRAETAKK
jgi:hypothetical protein